MNSSKRSEGEPSTGGADPRFPRGVQFILDAAPGDVLAALRRGALAERYGSTDFDDATASPAQIGIDMAAAGHYGGRAIVRTVNTDGDEMTLAIIPDGEYDAGRCLVTFLVVAPDTVRIDTCFQAFLQLAEVVQREALRAARPSTPGRDGLAGGLAGA